MELLFFFGGLGVGVVVTALYVHYIDDKTISNLQSQLSEAETKRSELDKLMNGHNDELAAYVYAARGIHFNRKQGA